ncbi:Major facilitator superfamily MFS_1 [Candidatus Sulfopaludibacter sp. SbA4]|nr:Major facilitator superfamily MFS_1 [Candidatus Sulfopaludibacter sp. SbA4]
MRVFIPMLATYLRLLRTNRNYRLLWMAQVVSELGDWFYSLAVYNLLLELTHNRAQSVGLAVVLQVLPHTFAAPTAGVVNDRISRRAIMIGADIARFFIVLGMLGVRTPGMVWMVYPLLLLETLGAAFFEPAHSAVIPNIVRASDVLAANALASITWSFCLAAGASLGGVVAVLYGRDTVFLLNAFSFLGSAWLIRRMRFDEPHAAGLPPLRGRDLVDFSPILEGFRYIRADSLLFATVFVKGGIGLLGANNVLLPVLGQRVFPAKFHGLDPARGAILGMSLLMGARGAGALLGPIIGGRWAGDRHSRLRSGIFAGFLLAAAGYMLLGTSTSLIVAVLTVVLAHAGSSTNWVFSTTLLQIYTTDRFRGRVFAADYGLCMLGISASSYLAGVAIDLGVPARTFAVVIGCVMLVPAGAWAIALAKTRRHG